MNESIHVTTAAELLNLFLPAGFAVVCDERGRIVAFELGGELRPTEGNSPVLEMPDGRMLTVHIGEPEEVL